LAFELEREFGAERVVTERELRCRELSAAWAAQRRGERFRPRHAVASAGSTSPRGLHFPDLVVEGGAPDGALLAVELERTAKGAARRRKIVAAYIDAVHVGQVRYYGTADVLRAVARSVAEQRGSQLAELFDLREWRPRDAAGAAGTAVAGLVPLPALATVTHHGHRHHHHHHRRHHRHHYPQVGGLPPQLQRLETGFFRWAGSIGIALFAVGLLLLAACRLGRLRWTWAPLLGIVATLALGPFLPIPLAALATGAFSTVLCTIRLWNDEREDERRGGRRRRRARAKVGPAQWLARRRARTRTRQWPGGAIELRPRRPWRRHAAGIALGESLTGRRPVWLGFDQLAKHLLILGATGGGKSNSLLWITTRAIRAGYGALVIDMKADPGLLERVQAEAGLWDRPFYVWRSAATASSTTRSSAATRPPGATDSPLLADIQRGLLPRPLLEAR
jgi:hypothetical protein